MNGDEIEKFLDRSNKFAVVGASRDPKKYGHRVYKDLKEAGYRVYPVNPGTEEILGDRCFPDLESLPSLPDVVDTVVPPKVTEDVVRTCQRLGIKMVWMQPGSESRNAIEFCETNRINVVHSVCIMVKRIEKP